MCHLQLAAPNFLLHVGSENRVRKLSETEAADGEGGRIAAQQSRREGKLRAQN